MSPIMQQALDSTQTAYDPLIIKAMEKQKQNLPEALRVKPFVINTDDIKLDQGLCTTTIEIEKVYLDKRKRSGLDDSDDDGMNRTLVAQSDTDISRVEKMQAESGVKIEVFSGKDPMFNIKNLKLRFRGLEKKDIYIIIAVFLLWSLCVSAAIIWLKVVLKGFSRQ